MPVAVDQYSGNVLNNRGEPLGRLGSQVWSPRYQHQLVTVMLEKPFYNGQNTQESIEVQCADGTLAQAQILPMPFNFKAAGITESN